MVSYKALNTNYGIMETTNVSLNCTFMELKLLRMVK